MYLVSLCILYERYRLCRKDFAFSGIYQSSDPTFPTNSTVEDTEEEDGFGDGDPSEVREFMEELGASEDSGATGTTATTSLPSLPTMIALGVVSFSAGVWKLCGDLSDIVLMSSPFGMKPIAQISLLYFLHISVMYVFSQVK